MWIDQGNGKHKLSGMNGAQRGESCVHDFADGGLGGVGVTNWQWCLGNNVRMQPVLHSPVTSGPFSTPYGWEYNLADGSVFGISDVSESKWAGLLDRFGFNGVTYYFVVPEHLIGDGEYRIEKIEYLDGAKASILLTDQGEAAPTLDADIGVVSEFEHPWVARSVVGYAKGKRHTNLSDPHKQFGSGKMFQRPPPLSLGLKISGALQAGYIINRSKAGGAKEFSGIWDITTYPNADEKVFNGAEVRSKMGQASHVIFAGTLGYSTEPSLYSHNINRKGITRFNCGFDGFSGDVVLNAIKFWTDANANGTYWKGGLYTGTATKPEAYVAATQEAQSNLSGKALIDIPFPASTLHTFNPDSYYATGFTSGNVSNVSGYYDLVALAPSTRHNYTTGLYDTDPWPDPFYPVTAYYTEWYQGAYLEFTEEGGVLLPSDMSGGMKTFSGGMTE